MKKNIDQIVEEALRQEPEFKLGLDFKDRVVKAIRRNEIKSQRRFYVLITVGVVLMLGLGLGLMAYFGSLQAFAGKSQLVPIAVIAGGVVVLIQYLDKKLVKDKMFKQLV